MIKFSLDINVVIVDDQDERSVSSVLLRDRHLHGFFLPRQCHPRHRRHGVRRLQETGRSRGRRGGTGELILDAVNLYLEVGEREKELIQGTTPGSRTRGRPKMTWIDNIKSWTGLSLTELTRKVEDKHQWRKIVHGVANPRNEDG